MRHLKLALPLLAIVTCVGLSCQSGNNENKTNDEIPTKGEMTREEMVSHGRMQVTLGGCNDCHSPKRFGPEGMAFDSSRLLSGHPANSQNPPVIASSLKPGGWVLMGPDLTTFVGPWGISYAANITPDSATGIGSWTERQFIQTLRTGRHMGLEGGRPIMPPMPWQPLGTLPEDELKSIFAYLQSLPPISNRVPGPVAPDAAASK